MSKIIREYFDNFVEAFDTGYLEESRSYHLSRRRHLVLEEVARLNPRPTDGLWLEAGCGAGVLACDLARLGFEVKGYDFSPQMIERARLNSRQLELSDRVTFDIGELQTLPFDDHSFAGLSCVGVIEYFDDPWPVLSEFARVLRPGAPFIVTFNNYLSPFRWLSGPAKVLRARLQQRQAQVPVIVNHSYTVRRATRMLRQKHLRVHSWRRHTFTCHLKEGLWLPPLGLARKMEGLADIPLLRELAWSLIAVGRRRK